jgi:hypothetical protein
MNNNNNKDKLRKLEQDFAQVFGTAAGKRVLSFITISSGFTVPSVVVTETGAVDATGTLFNEARRGLYLDMRKFIKPEILREVEIPIGDFDE